MNRRRALLAAACALYLAWIGAAQTPEASPPATPPAPTPRTESAPAAAPAEVPAYFKAHQAAWDEGSNAESANPAAASPAKEPGWSYYVPRMLMGLFVVCGLILLSASLLRRLGKNSPLLSGPRLGTILGKIHLSPKTALFYVRTGGKVLVIGTTPDTIAPIAEFDVELFEAEQEAPNAPSEAESAGFLEQLRASVKQEAPAAKTDDDLVKLRGDLQRLQHYLQESAREIREP